MKHRHIFSRIILTAFLLAPMGQAAAQNAPLGLEQVRSEMDLCLKSSDAVVRVRCYDALAAKMGIAQADWQREQEQKTAKLGLWQIIDRKNELNQNEIFLKLSSSNLVRDSYGNTRNPVLNVRCVNRKTEVFLDWQGSINLRPNITHYPVEFVIDDGATVKENWELSKDQFAVFSLDPTTMVRNLRGSKRVIIRLTPTREMQSSLTFDMRGFDEALKLLIQRCYPS